MNCLELKFHRTLQQTRQDFFCISNQEIDLWNMYCRYNKSTNDYHIVSTLDNYFWHKQSMPSSCHKFTNKCVFYQCFPFSSFFVQIRWNIENKVNHGDLQIKVIKMPGPLPIFSQSDTWSTLLQIHILNSKQCRFRSVGFWRSQLIWIYTVCYDRACCVQQEKGYYFHFILSNER